MGQLRTFSIRNANTNDILSSGKALMDFLVPDSGQEVSCTIKQMEVTAFPYVNSSLAEVYVKYDGKLQTINDDTPDAVRKFVKNELESIKAGHQNGEIPPSPLENCLVVGTVY